MSHSDGYRAQDAWRRIQQHLPAEDRLAPDREPSEEFWEWQGHSIHLDRFAKPDAPAKVILFHGVGTNGRQMSTILGRPLFDKGYEAIAIDMPGYGVTRVGKGLRVTYDDWVRAACDLIALERAKDGRPIFLYGLSAGGMLAYHAAAIDRRVAGIVGMTFLDQRIQQVSDETAYNALISRVGVPMAKLSNAIGLGGFPVPMRAVSKMRDLVNDKAALADFYADKTSAGNWVTQAFLATYSGYRPALEPEDFDVCPILLTQPAEDRWTPLHLSKLFLDRIRRVSVETVMLENAGHYPIEQPGLRQMRDAIFTFIDRNLQSLRKAG